ncbi:MAG: formate dehydrogenase subunit delta [Aestuariivirga sp.]
METQDMVRMANQIAGFFKGYPHDDAVRESATHLNNFWDPRMRKQLFAHLAKGGAGLDPLIIEASAQIRKPKTEAA